MYQKAVPNVPARVGGPRTASGFTLIEIVIALAIVAIAVLAIANAMNQHTQISAGLEKRVIASWVAANHISEIRHESKLSRLRPGNSSDVITMGGHKWRAQAKITRTDVERVYLLTVTVKDESRRQDAAYATVTTAINDNF